MSQTDISRRIRAVPFSQATDAQISPGEFVNVAAANQLVFQGTAGAPLSVSNLDSVEQVSGAIALVAPRSTTNIQESFGGSAMASGFWKITLYINSASGFGKTEQHVWNGGPDSTPAQAKNAANLLLAARKTLLGGMTGGHVKGGPCIEFYRVSDAINPRNSSLVESGTGMVGPSSSADAPSDFLTTAIVWQMIGTTAATPAQTTKATAAIVGQPDACVAAESYVPGALLGDGRTIDAALNVWLAYLKSPRNKLGFMGLAAAQPKKVFAKVGLGPTNLFRFTLVAHGYQTGDRVRLTGSRVPGWAGVYKVIRVDNDIIDLDARIPTTATQPNTATFQRIQTSDKVRQLDFYAYTGYTDTPYRIRKRNPGKAFKGLSFKHKTRRAA